MTIRQVLGPADHGRPLAFADYLAGDYQEGYQYELIDGKLYVSPTANAPQGRIEIYLEALRDQRVNLDGHVRAFAAGERIHTENSYKYAPAEFIALLEQAEFHDVVVWQDEGRDFAVYGARV